MPVRVERIKTRITPLWLHNACICIMQLRSAKRNTLRRAVVTGQAGVTVWSALHCSSTDKKLLYCTARKRAATTGYECCSYRWWGLHGFPSDEVQLVCKMSSIDHEVCIGLGSGLRGEALS